MAAVGAANRSDSRRVARSRKPVVDCGADPPALDRRLARPVVAGDQQEDAVAAAIARSRPRSIARQALSSFIPWRSSDAVGLDRAGAKPPVPAAVERRSRAAGGPAEPDWSGDSRLAGRCGFGS